MILNKQFVHDGLWLFRYRSYLPLIILGIALVVAYRYMDTAPVAYGYYQLFGAGLSVVGLWIRVKTVGHTPANTSGRNTQEGQVADDLNTLGWYSVVRHPLYVGNFLMWLGVGVWTTSVVFCIVFCLVYWLYYERIMMAEEDFLIQKFGDAYLQWADKVPAFIPSFSKWQSPSLSFSWKKVLAKEKNGLFALGVLLYLFKVVYNFKLGMSNPWIDTEMLVMISTGIIYFLLKAFKMSGMLDEEGR